MTKPRLCVSQVKCTVFEFIFFISSAIKIENQGAIDVELSLGERIRTKKHLLLIKMLLTSLFHERNAL